MLHAELQNITLCNIIMTSFVMDALGILGNQFLKSGYSGALISTCWKL